MTICELIKELERCSRMSPRGDKTVVTVVREGTPNVDILTVLNGESDNGLIVYLYIEESNA
jgi:hypothetical protein